MLYDDNAVFTSILNSSAAVERSFPHQEMVKPEALEVLGKVYQKGHLPFDIHDKGMELCFKNGWIHVDVDETSSSQICFLPSRLHEK